MHRYIAITLCIFILCCKKRPASEETPQSAVGSLTLADIKAILDNPIIDPESLSRPDFSKAIESPPDLLWQESSRGTTAWVNLLLRQFPDETAAQARVVANPGFAGFTRDHEMYVAGFFIILDEPEAYLWTLCHELGHWITSDQNHLGDVRKIEKKIDVKGLALCAQAGMPPKDYLHGMKRNDLALLNAKRLGWLPPLTEGAFQERIPSVSLAESKVTPSHSRLYEDIKLQINDWRGNLLKDEALSQVLLAKDEIFKR